MFIASIVTIVLALFLAYQALGMYGVVDIITLSEQTNPYLTAMNVCVLKWSPILAFVLLSMGILGVWFLHKDKDQFKIVMLNLVIGVLTAILSIL